MMLMACEKLQGIRTCVTLVGDKSQGIRIAILLACEMPQGMCTFGTLVDNESQGIRIAVLP